LTVPDGFRDNSCQYRERYALSTRTPCNAHAVSS
jgi:hypothetical protein